jgi:hypothetical protein
MQIKDMLFTQTPASLAYSLSILMAIAYVLYLYPLSFLLGHGFFFTTGDASQHVAGWLFYSKDEWRFPLLYTERVNYPEGVSIAFMDSIPLIALLLKPIAPLLPEGFHYIGAWQGITYLIQAIAAVFLFRALGYKGLLENLVAAFFAITWSTIVFRMGHTSLMTHGLILFSLAFYFLGRQGKWQSNTATIALISTSAIALLVHPYLMAMCYGVFLAFLADQVFSGESFKKQILRVIISLVIFIFLAATLGYMGPSSSDVSGFGYYSMNLIAPFCGGSFLNCNFDATGGQYEGFNYLGIGVLILCLFTLITQSHQIKNIIKQYPALIIMVIIFTLYSLSTKVYLGSYKIVTYSLHGVFDFLVHTFRSSGRFFWITGYLILFAALAGLFAYRDKKVIIFLLLVTIPLQWFDLQPIRNSTSATAEKPNTLDDKVWPVIFSNVERINLYPLFRCDNSSTETVWLFQRLAAQYNKIFNTGYISRSNIDCNEKSTIFHEPFQLNQAYVLPLRETQNQPATIPMGFSKALEKNECIEYQETLVCIPGLKQNDINLITQTIIESRQLP